MSEYLTRDEAISWCIKNNSNFDKPTPFPPPIGWMWAVLDHTHCLTPEMLFDYDDDGDIESIDVLLIIAARQQKRSVEDIMKKHSLRKQSQNSTNQG